MKGRDLVLDRLVRSSCLQNQDAVTGFRQIHRDGPAAGAGPYNDKVVFVLYAAREHRVAILAVFTYPQSTADNQRLGAAVVLVEMIIAITG
jgi:hypothetical protein